MGRPLGSLISTARGVVVAAMAAKRCPGSRQKNVTKEEGSV